MNREIAIMLMVTWFFLGMLWGVWLTVVVLRR